MLVQHFGQSCGQSTVQFRTELNCSPSSHIASRHRFQAFRKYLRPFNYFSLCCVARSHSNIFNLESFSKDKTADQFHCQEDNEAAKIVFLEKFINKSIQNNDYPNDFLPKPNSTPSLLLSIVQDCDCDGKNIQYIKKTINKTQNSGLSESFY